MKRRVGHVKIIITLFAILTSSISSLCNDSLKISNTNFLELSDGLQSRFVFDIEKDHQQYLWLLINHGIQIFDGEDFLNFKKSTIANDYNSIYADSTGVYCSFNNFNVQHYVNFREEPITYNPSQNLLGTIHSFSNNPKSFDFICTKENDSYHFYTNYQDPNLIASVQWDSDIDAWVHFNEKIYFLSNELLYEYDESLKVVFGESLEAEILSFKHYLHISNDHLTFSFSNKSGIHILDKKNQFNTITPDYNLVFVAEDDKGRLALGTTHTFLHRLDGLLIYDPYFGTSKNASAVLEKNRYLTDVHGTDFHRKVTASSYNGIYEFTFFAEGISNFFKDQNIAKSNFGPVILDFTSVDNTLFFIRESAGIWQYKNGVYSVALDEPPLDYGLTDLEYDKENNKFWTLSYNPNRRYDLIKSSKSKIEKIVPYDFIIRNMKLSRSNEITFIGNHNEESKYWKYLIDQDTTLLIKNLGKGSTNDVHTINEKIWIAKESGLQIENIKTGTTQQYEACEMASLIQKIDDHVFVHTRGNGCFVFKNDSIYMELNSSNKLSNDNTTGLLKDRNGNYWIGTYNGINILNENFETIYILYEEDGLSANEMNTGALHDDGTYFYFGTLNGITKINPTEFLDNIEQQTYLRTNLSYWIDDEERKAEKSGNEYKISGIPSRIEIKLENNQTIENTNLSKLYDLETNYHSENVRFFDNRIIINNPGKGNSDIILKSRLNGHDTLLASLVVTRNLSLLFLIGFITLSVILLSYIISSGFIKRNKERAEEKTSLVKRISEVELEALRSQMNPHFIFNALNSIQYYILKNEKHFAGKYLSKFAKLMRMILESSKSKHLSLEKEIEQLNLYLELEKLRFEDKFDYEFDVADDVIIQEETIPTMLIQPFIENAILHGINHKQNNEGFINIKFFKENNQLICEIDDNGIGRTEALEIKQSKTMEHTSRATQMIDERLELLDNLGHEKIDVEYEDKYDNSKNALGTKVIIKFHERR